MYLMPTGIRLLNRFTVTTSLVLEFMFRGFVFCKFMKIVDERKFLAILVHTD